MSPYHLTLLIDAWIRRVNSARHCQALPGTSETVRRAAREVETVLDARIELARQYRSRRLRDVTY